MKVFNFIFFLNIENLGKEGDKGYRMMQQRLDLLYARDKATLAQSQND